MEGTRGAFTAEIPASALVAQRSDGGMGGAAALLNRTQWYRDCAVAALARPAA